MPKPIRFKTQIEVRYSNILDFSSAYKRIVAPLLEHAKFTIENAGLLEEFIVLTFQEASYILDIRWDRLVFVCEGLPENLFSSNGHLFHFLSVLKKLQSLDTFGTITQILYASWDLFEKPNKEQRIVVQEYEKQFLNSCPLSHDGEIDDMAIVYNLKFKEDTLRLHFGPFKADTDVSGHNLTPLGVSNESKSNREKKGILAQSIYVHKAKEFSIDGLHRFHKKIYNSLKILENE